MHKVDRLARNRADDVVINLRQLQAGGARLVSVTENIDQTPSGLLLHGIMSSIAEFYSPQPGERGHQGHAAEGHGRRHAGTARRSATATSASSIDGREVRTVDLDPERAPLMRWAFEAYASGDWTLRSCSPS